MTVAPDTLRGTVNPTAGATGSVLGPEEVQDRLGLCRQRMSCAGYLDEGRAGDELGQPADHGMGVDHPVVLAHDPQHRNVQLSQCPFDVERVQHIMQPQRVRLGLQRGPRRCAETGLPDQIDRVGPEMA